ncbi:MAG: DeoR/GlpR transcriptional regulator [Phycisphaeraceae bacterium]|nr:DeoR/GlpR transcriptional regulator [Phycisphaeraceae bacterium]
MLIVERQQRLLETLRRQKAAQLDELARQVGVSASTVRRDLERLEEQGLVQRTHGGAVYVEQDKGPRGQTTVLAERMGTQVDAKQALGAYAASLVQPHMTVLLDGGSTVLFAAQQIVARPLQVVTNSVPVANLFADDDDVELMLIGGSLYPRSGVLVGPIATGCLADLHANLMFFSVAGIYGEECYNQNLAMAQVEQVMLRQTSQSVLLMDSSKFGHKSLTRVCGLEEVDQIVTDGGISEEWRGKLGERLRVV